MKEAAAFFFLVLLVLFGWNQPFKEQYRAFLGLPPQDTRLLPVPQGAPAPQPKGLYGR